MIILLRSAVSYRRAAELYGGDSLPISALKEGREPLSVSWWMSGSKEEEAGTDRHRTALQLYLEIAKSARPALPLMTFPAVLDFEDKAARPDKGVVKVLLDEGLVVDRMLGAQLVFDVTERGVRFLREKERSAQ